MLRKHFPPKNQLGNSFFVVFIQLENRAPTRKVPQPHNSLLSQGRARLDAYGYGLPEIDGAMEVSVPLVVGDQQVFAPRFELEFWRESANSRW